MQNGYLPIDMKFADKRRYYSCFDRYYQKGEAGPMILLVAEYVEEQLRHYLSVLDNRKEN
jgi:hypothetical protein